MTFPNPADQPINRYAYRFTWKAKNGTYVSTKIYAEQLEKAKEIFEKQYHMSVEAAGVLVDRLPISRS